METSGHRRELYSILSLFVGAFIGFALFPTALTGPLGRVVRQLLLTWLGSGAVIIPPTFLAVAAVGLGWWKRITPIRMAVLGAGMVFLVPYGIAVLTGFRQIDWTTADYTLWPFRRQLVGMIPAFLAVSVTGVIGSIGAALLGLLGLSTLTVSTVGWHPFRRLRARVASTNLPEPEPEVTYPEIQESKPLRKLVPFRRRSVPADADSEEQAFVSGEAIQPFSVDELNAPKRVRTAEDEAELDRLGDVLIETLKTFRVEAELGPHRSTGPVVTQYEVKPAPGVKVGRIASLADDLALKMEAQSIRIVAPIPGKPYVGVEVPNPTPRIVTLRELLSPPHWDPNRTGLPIALGKDLEGRPVSADLTKMPHLLIAGATGSGKSVCINTVITSLIFRYTERELRMLMIDPKMVELTAYNALPHMIYPVVTNNRDAAKALKWVNYEMEDRYALFSVNNVRNLHEFNRKVRDGKKVVQPRKSGEDEEDDEPRRGRIPTEEYDGTTLPYVVVVVDELADLMMTVQGEVEKPLAMLAQKARATGIHLVLATQRPSVNVITGLIKANFPSRIAFRVASKVDSRTILDQNGAEALLGNGDMLFLPPGRSEAVRVQGAFIGTEETERIMRWYEEKRVGGDTAETAATPAQTLPDILAIVQEREREEEGATGPRGVADDDERDALFKDAAEVCVQQQLGSTSLLQRKLRIGYGRAARIIDQLHDAGILGPPDGSKPREVLIAPHQVDEYCD